MSRRRLFLVAAAAAYAAVFFAVYQLAVAPRYDYYGLSTRELGAADLGLIFVLAILPATWMPTSIRRPSVLLFLALYILVYVPTIMIAFYSSLPRLELEDARLLVLALFSGISLLSLVYLVPVVAVRRPPVTPRLFWGGVLGLAGTLYGYLLIRFGGVFRFVAFADVDLQRQAFGSVVDTFGAYAIAWLAAAINPLLAAWGFVSRRYWLVAAALLGQVLLFGAGGAKAYVLSVPLIVGLGIAIPRYAARFPSVALTGTSAGVAVGPLIGAAGAPVIGHVALFLVMFRSLCIPGLATVQYYGFFQYHPHTFGSHIRGLSSLVQYPFVLPLDRLMAFHYYDTLLSATNANLWATDAIAGFGLWAMVPVSLLCGVVFYVIDSVAVGLPIRLTVVALAFGAANFSNVPLGTNLLTGGVGILIVLFYLMPRQLEVPSAIHVR